MASSVGRKISYESDIDYVSIYDPSPETRLEAARACASRGDISTLRAVLNALAAKGYRDDDSNGAAGLVAFCTEAEQFENAVGEDALLDLSDPFALHLLELTAHIKPSNASRIHTAQQEILKDPELASRFSALRARGCGFRRLGVS